MVKRKNPDTDPGAQLFEFTQRPAVVNFPRSAPKDSKGLKNHSVLKPIDPTEKNLVKEELVVVTGQEFYHWVQIVDSALETAEEDLNRLAQAAGEDAKTGSNASATWENVRKGLEKIASSGQKDLSWTLSVASETAQDHIHGVAGVLLTSWLKTAAKLTDGTNSWDGPHLQSGLLSLWATCADSLLPSPGKNSLFSVDLKSSQPLICTSQKLAEFTTPIRQELMAATVETSIEMLLAQNWLSSQESLSNLADRCEHIADPYAALLMLLAGAMLETAAKSRGEYIGAIDTSLAMIKDLSIDGQLFRANHNKAQSGLGGFTPNLPEVQITWRGLLGSEQVPKLLTSFADHLTSGGYCPADQGDLLGLGRQTLVLRTRRPQLVLRELEQWAGQAQIRLLQPIIPEAQPTVTEVENEPMEWALFSERVLTSGQNSGKTDTGWGSTGVGAGSRGNLGMRNSNLTGTRGGRNQTSSPLLLQKKSVAPEIPQVVAFTSAIGLVTDLVATGAQVLWGADLDDPQADYPLLPMFLRLKSAVIQAVPDCPKTAARLSAYERELKKHGVTLLVAPTRDDLQVLHVTRQVAMVVQAGLPSRQLVELQRSRTLAALESQRTVPVWPEMEDQALAELVTEHDLQVQILLSKTAESTFISRLQALIMQVAPYIRVEVLPGGSAGPTVLGFSGGRY